MRRNHHRRAWRVNERIPDGLGAPNGLEADVAIGARAVLDDEGLAERLGEPRPEHARGDIGHAAWRDVHDHAHRLHGPLLAMRGRREQRQCGNEDAHQTHFSRFAASSMMLRSACFATSIVAFTKPSWCYRSMLACSALRSGFMSGS